MNWDKESREYHAAPRPGKIEVAATKPCVTQRDLFLAYTPRVAAPCLDIQKSPDKCGEFTSRGNLVTVVSNVSNGTVEAPTNFAEEEKKQFSTRFLLAIGLLK